ncbi:MAG: type IX secretion system membrane protein PorP/SprF, partial [Bacteroidota bacterium]|nr:type IX secretion system membrane protein PorP/SprF [Bacteroidota bacterium]
MRIDSNSLRRLASLLALGGLLTGAGMGEAKAQQDVMISQYLFNGLLINPGYAGSHPYTSSSLLHRSQWSQ